MPMMMAANVPAGAESGVYALLALIADPKACKARLEELAAATEAASLAVDEANALKAELDKRSVALREGEQSLADRTDAVTRREALVAQREEQLGPVAAQLEADRAALSQEEGQRVADWNTREENLRNREAAIDELQKRAEESAAAAEKLRRDYEDKLAKLRALAG